MNANPVRQSLFGLLLVLPLLAFVGAPAQAQPAPAGCGGHDGIEFICGLRNIEDMDQVPGRPVLIAASYGTVPAGAPRLLAINTDTRAITPLAITAPSKPDAIYAACPAPLDMTKFSPHGIAIRGGKDGQHILYVVNHGGRESIEIFAVDARSAELKARWLGCVVLPEGASGNAVAPLEDGGFVATKFYDTRDGEQRPQFLARKKNSVIYRWSPKTGLVIVPGGEMVGDNGVLVSPDGQWLYVTSWIEKRIIRMPLSGHGEITSAPVDFLPDNLRWAPDGSIIAAGQATSIELLIACKHTQCPADWGVARLDPKTMSVGYYYWEKGTPEFAAATTAIPVGNKFWIGTFRGDRIIIVNAPSEFIHP